MWQGEKLKKMAKDLGIDYENSSSEQEVIENIANKVGMEDYNNLYDKDKLEEKLNYYLNNRDDWDKYNNEYNKNNKRNAIQMPSNRNSMLSNTLKKSTTQNLLKKPSINNNLAKNLANRKNYLSFLNRKKKNNSDNNESQEESDGNNSNNGSIEEKSIIAIKKIKTVKMFVMIVAPIVFLLVLILLIISIVGYVGGLFGVVSGSSDLSSMTDNTNEQKYYDKLNSVVKSYRESCGIELNKNYIHTILIYPTNNYSDFFDQDFSLESISNGNNSLDYETLSGKVDTVAGLLVNSCNVDYEVDGSSYNRIKNSAFFRDYYKELLKKADADTILTDVFDLAEVGTNLFASSWFINDNLKVNLGNCKFNGNYLDKEVNNTVGFSDYIMGVIYGEMGGKYITRENKEFLKAFTIVASSYVLSNSGYVSGDTEIFARNGNCWQLSADINKGSTYISDGQFSTMYPGRLDNGEYFPPLSSEKRAILSEVFKEVFGTLMVSDDGRIKRASYRNYLTQCDDNECLGQQDAVKDAQSGMSYQQILNKYYSNFTLTNAQEDLYADNVTYDSGGYNNKVVTYRQTDYNQKFCGRPSATISTSGCGVTSMAIVLSTLVDDSYNPVVVMDEAMNFNSCGIGIDGTKSSFFKKSATLHNLGYKSVAKRGNLQAVSDALKSGNSLVIAHMGKGTFTGGGHYIVLSAISDDGKVKVIDPYHDINKKRRNSGDGWYDFNSVIVKQLIGSFHIITKG